MEIADAQQDVSPDCVASCSGSIRELLGGLAPSNFNTVPFQLICNSANEAVPGACGTVFVGQGFRRAPGSTDPTSLQYATSTFFRVSSVDPETCCAVIELLCNPEVGPTPAPALDPVPVDPNVCPIAQTAAFTRTGICITVDLNCFCGVVCLPAQSLTFA
jgi:spore coat protein Z